jgi:hypothetical protein
MALRRPKLTPLQARRRLGRILFEEMERADPDPEPVSWTELSPSDRHFYINRIADLFDHPELIRVALEDPHLLLHSYEGRPD